MHALRCACLLTRTGWSTHSSHCRLSTVSKAFVVQSSFQPARVREGKYIVWIENPSSRWKLQIVQDRKKNHPKNQQQNTSKWTYEGQPEKSARKIAKKLDQQNTTEKVNQYESPRFFFFSSHKMSVSVPILRVSKNVRGHRDGPYHQSICVTCTGLRFVGGVWTTARDTCAIQIATAFFVRTRKKGSYAMYLSSVSSWKREQKSWKKRNPRSYR